MAKNETKITFESILLYVREVSSVVACYLVTNTVISFVALSVMSKYGKDSYQLTGIVILTLIYLALTYIDICSSAKADFSVAGIAKGLIAVFFMLLLGAAFYYGVMDAARMDDFIHPIMK